MNLFRTFGGSGYIGGILLSLTYPRVFSAETPYDIYEKALDYLWNAYSEFRVTGQNWKIRHFFDEKLDRTSSIKEAIPVLRKNHDSCPKVLTLSASNRIKLRHLLSTAHANFGSPLRTKKMLIQKMRWLICMNITG